ncbi:MAG: site-specific DNA-methyltransferase, partial [Candidatus Thermoplasmatota archaeon]|nr:site-specific DNA-methyltransferase [Candidatus Thermoplasmatota archaeon]
EAFDPLFDTFQFVVWHKTNPPPKLYRAGFLNSCELIVCMWNKGHIWNFGRQSEMHNFIESPICMGRERVKNPTHPTQKPLKVLNKIIEIASHQSDVVFDPFMGVGSTGVSAVQLSRNFIGFEVNPEYFAVAKERIETANKNEIEGGPESKEESPPYS